MGDSYISWRKVEIKLILLILLGSGMRQELEEVIEVIESMLEIADRMTGADREAMQLLIYTAYGMLHFVIEEESEEESEEETDDPMN